MFFVFVDLHCIYNELVKSNGVLVVSYGPSDQAGHSARASLCRLRPDQTDLICQMQAYSMPSL